MLTIIISISKIIYYIILQNRVCANINTIYVIIYPSYFLIILKLILKHYLLFPIIEQHNNIKLHESYDTYICTYVCLRID